MRILFLATRLAGTDGVSLESAKLRAVLEASGHQVRYCAGELPPGDGFLIPEMHFTDPVAAALGERAFSGPGRDSQLDAAIEAQAGVLEEQLTAVVERAAPDLLVVQNAWAIPMQLPLAVAIARLVRARGLAVISHNHDYWWERGRFAHSRVRELLERYFPFAGPGIVQLSINSAARRALLARRGLDSLLLPNVLDFATPPPPPDAFSADFRGQLGIGEHQPLLLQPTRVVPRKGIELSLELARRLADLNPLLLISHAAGDEGGVYLPDLKRRAERLGVRLVHAAGQVGERREIKNGRKIYRLWDVYPHADLVTYPSLYEGFGNALLEAVWFRKPLLVNRYPVYVDDIAPKGFSFVEIDGVLSESAVRQARRLLEEPPGAERATARNYRLGLEHYGYGTLRRVLGEAFGRLGLDMGAA